MLIELSRPAPMVREFLNAEAFHRGGTAHPVRAWLWGCPGPPCARGPREPPQVPQLLGEASV
jgi:hypothetical protein